MATNTVDLYRLTDTASVSADARHGILARAVQLLGDRWRYRRTVDELSALSDRDLADIGIERDAIPGVARRCACGTA